MRSIDSLIEAVATGKAVRTRLGLARLGRLSREKLWPAAMRAVVDLGTAHPAAQEQFLRIWMRVGGGSVLVDQIGDADLMVAALRVLLPPYNGPIMKLYRGQMRDEPIGFSWSRSYHIALKFALYGQSNVDVHDLDASARRQGYKPRTGLVLSALAPPAAIICAPCLLGHAEGEYIVDPRKIDLA